MRTILYANLPCKERVESMGQHACCVRCEGERKAQSCWPRGRFKTTSGKIWGLKFKVLEKDMPHQLGIIVMKLFI